LIPKLQLGVELFKPPPPPERPHEWAPSTTLMETTTGLATAGGESKDILKNWAVAIRLEFSSGEPNQKSDQRNAGCAFATSGTLAAALKGR
jgi:hypothetical protein